MNIRARKILAIVVCSFSLWLLIGSSVLAQSATSSVTAQPLSSSPAQIISDNYFRHSDKVILDKWYQKDVVVTGNRVVVTGRIDGDLLVIGRQVEIEGVVNGNVWLLAGELKVKGKIGESLKGAAAKAEIEGEIGRNLWLWGGQINSTAQVGWHIIFQGDQLEIGGKAERVDIKGKRVKLNGDFVYSRVFIGDPRGRLSVAPSASLGQLDYYSFPPASIDKQAEIGEVNFRKLDSSAFVYERFFKMLISLFSLLSLALVVFYLTPLWLRHTVELLGEEIGLNVIWGVGWLVLAPLVAIVLLFTLIGIPLALLLLGFWVLGFYLAQVFVSFWLGRLLYFKIRREKLLQPGSYSSLSFWQVVIGAVIFKLIIALPILGVGLWMISLVVALGAALRVIKTYIKA